MTFNAVAQNPVLQVNYSHLHVTITQLLAIKSFIILYIFMTNDPDRAVRMVAYYELLLLVNVVWNIVSLHSNASCLFQDKDNTLDALLK